MNVAIYSRKIKKKNIPFLKHLLEELERLNWNPIFENSLLHQLDSKLEIKKKYSSYKDYTDFLTGIDLAISIGGDGTFLETIRYVRNSNVPVLGINTGRLGFLADIKTENFEQVLEKIDRKDFYLQKRALIQVETEDDVFGANNLAVNEAAVHKKDTSSMITIEAYLEGRYLNSYWADGLLVGTPTGSTAYNLSCGGPIIAPESGVHFITPIAAHNLNVRPVIIPDNILITLKIIGRSKNFLLTLDSESKTLKTGAEIKLHKSDFSINLVQFQDSDFFKTIREKMFWGVDQRNE